MNDDHPEDLPEVTVTDISDGFTPVLGAQPYVVIEVVPAEIGTTENIRIGGFNVDDPNQMGMMSGVLLRVGTQLRAMSRESRKQQQDQIRKARA